MKKMEYDKGSYYYDDMGESDMIFRKNKKCKASMFDLNSKKQKG